VRNLDLGEDLLGHGDGVRNVGVRVGERHEASLVLRGRQVDAALQHAAMPLGELGRVRFGRVGEALDRARGEEEAKHARDVAAADGVALGAPGVKDA